MYPFACTSGSAPIGLRAARMAVRREMVGVSTSGSRGPFAGPPGSDGRADSPFAWTFPVCTTFGGTTMATGCMRVSISLADIGRGGFGGEHALRYPEQVEDLRRDLAGQDV